MSTSIDRDWEAENDASTLAEAELIKADEKRMKKAQEAAKKMADEARDRAHALEDASRAYPKSNMPPAKSLY